MEKSSDYIKGYYDAIYGRMVPWAHLLNREYHAGRLAGDKVAIRKVTGRK